MATASAGLYAQTALNPGEVQLIGFRSDDPDGFSFVNWVPLADSTAVSFTDNGWAAADSIGFSNTSESACTWTNTTGQILPVGTVVVVVCSGGPCTSTVGSISGSMGGLSVSGDQIFVYQGSLAQAQLIDGLNFDGSGWAPDRTNSNNSALPAALALGGWHTAVPEWDNGEYSGSRTGSIASGFASLIRDPSQWTLENDGALLPALSGVAFSLGSGPLPEPSYSADSLNVVLRGVDAAKVQWFMPSAPPSGTSPTQLLLRLSRTGWPSGPVDGTPISADFDWSDGATDYLLPPNSDSLIVSGLPPETVLFASMWALTNQGASVDYLATPVRSDSVKTPSLPYGPGSVRITEICDAPFFVDEFMEIVNLSGVELPTRGLKLVRMAQNPPHNVEYIFDFGLESTLDTVLPAGGVLVVCRGSSDRTSFEAYWGPMDSATAFVRGTNGLFFGTTTPRRWQLRYGGLPDEDDGILFDDTESAVGGAVRWHRSLAQATASTAPASGGNPGRLGEYVHTDWGWIQGEEPDTGSTIDPVYLHSGTALFDGNYEWAYLGMEADAQLRLEPGSLLRLAQARVDSLSVVELRSNAQSSSTYLGPPVPIRSSVQLSTGGLTGRWMYLAPPVAVTVDSLLSDFTQVNYAPHTSPSVFAYDGVDFVPLSSGTAVAPGQGILAYAGSAFGVAYSGPQIWVGAEGWSRVDSLGVPTTDEPGTSAAGYQGGDRGWNLLGNPYPANLRVADLMSLNAQGNFGAAYTFDGNGFIFGTSSGVGDFHTLRPFQAFWVQSDSSTYTPTDSFVFVQSAAVSSMGDRYKQNTLAEPAEVVIHWPNGYQEKWYATVRSDADSLFDPRIDVLKWKSMEDGYAHIYSMGADSLPLALDAFDVDRAFVDLRIETESPVMLRMDFHRFSAVFGTQWWFEDRLTGQHYNATDTTIAIHFDPGKTHRRFRLHFRPEDFGPAVWPGTVALVRSEPGQWVLFWGSFYPPQQLNFQLFDTSGKQVFQTRTSTERPLTVPYGSLPSGVYIATWSSDSGASSQTLYRP